MMHRNHKSPRLIQRAVKYGSLLLAVSGVVILALITFLAPRPESGSLPPVQRVARLGLQGSDSTQVAQVEALECPLRGQKTAPDEHPRVHEQTLAGCKRPGSLLETGKQE